MERAQVTLLLMYSLHWTSPKLSRDFDSICGAFGFIATCCTLGAVAFYGWEEEVGGEIPLDDVSNAEDLAMVITCGAENTIANLKLARLNLLEFTRFLALGLVGAQRKLHARSGGLVLNRAIFEPLWYRCIATRFGL